MMSNPTVQVDDILRSWPEKPQEVARKVIAKYGQPAEAVPSRLIWYNTGPWKRTIVYRDEVPHQFPKPHTDLLEQVIDYRVPAEKFDDLAAFDGSVFAERTKGELAARCDKEEMNFLAFNLAHDVITGQRSVEAARETYAETAAAFMLGEQRPYTQGLQFAVPQGDTADPDTPALGDAMKGAAKAVGDKVKDALS
jgi:hypothetical protein